MARSDVQRIGFKFFVERCDGVELPECIPIFHRWIQTHAVDGLLIDVADYSHVTGGPGIMLLAHEGDYAIDATDGRLGLRYRRKQPAPGDLAQRLRSTCRTVLAACRQLETAPELGRRLTFRGDEFVFLTYDRLLVPNTDDTLAAVRPSLSALVATLYPGAECRLVREPDARELFAVNVTAAHAVAIETLLERLGRPAR